MEYSPLAAKNLAVGLAYSICIDFFLRSATLAKDARWAPNRFTHSTFDWTPSP